MPRIMPSDIQHHAQHEESYLIRYGGHCLFTLSANRKHTARQTIAVLRCERNHGVAGTSLPARPQPSPLFTNSPRANPHQARCPVKRGVTHWGRMQLPAFPRRLSSRLRPFAAYSSLRPAAHGQDAGSVIRRASCQSTTSDPPAPPG
jgi:hypothetical protein